MIGLSITNWLSLALVLIPLAVASIVRLIRLEGKVSSVQGRLDNLEAAAKTHAETKIEVVRLQEQIKHLTDLLERYFIKSRAHEDYGQ